MDRDNKYYDIIANLIQNHRKYKDFDAILDNLIDYVYKEAESMIECISKNIPIYELSRDNYIEQINKADIIINATPVGMHPKIDEELFEDDVFKSIKNVSSKCFFDVIFNPYKTKFLINAEKYGAKTCSGLYMMIYQILLAFEIWTNIKTDDIDVEDASKEILKNGYNVEEL